MATDFGAIHLSRFVVRTVKMGTHKLVLMAELCFTVVAGIEGEK